MNVPNVITAVRALLVPAVVWLVLAGDMRAAFLLFALAGASDAADGYLAKRFGWETALGAYLDPLADKMLIVGVFVALGAAGVLPQWLVTAAVARDLLIVTGIAAAWAAGRPLRIRPLTVSKLNTFAQITVAALVLADEGFGLGLGGARLLLVWATGLLTFVSFAAYLDIWLRHMAAERAPE